MSEITNPITRVRLSAVADLGHGGPLSEYRIDPNGEGYTVTLRISLLSSRPGEMPPPPQPPSASPRLLSPIGKTPFNSSQITETLMKERQQVEEFLRKLSAEFNVFELTDLKFPFFLHPTTYSFSFQDAAGRSHSFEYRIECSSHLDERYRVLVEEFESFFESRRVFEKFYESRRNG